MEKDEFLNNVKNYSYNKPVRFHMPGHKGKAICDYQNNLLPFDLTELKTTDNLYAPELNGGIHQAFDYAKTIYGTVNTVFSAGGATLCLQVAIMSVARKYGTKRIICDRRCHKSVINALILCDIEPVWVDVFKLTEIPEASAMIITSTDYYGRICDVKHISNMCREHNITLICDNAHGAHLAYYDNGNLHPYKNGADIVIDSLHKTLPALTGAALLHTNDCVDEDMLLSTIRLFASTSPSYLISISIYSCIDYMNNEGRERLNCLYGEIADCKNILKNIGYTILETSFYDPFRICINLRNAEELYDYLYDNNIVCEFYDRNNVILIPSVMNTTDDFKQLIKLCEQFTPIASETLIYPVYLPKRAISARESLFLKSGSVDINKAVDKICAEIYAPYPPGIPLIIPGEIFDDYIIQQLKSYGETHVKIHV